MPTVNKKFGFIRTTLALWAANVGSFIRAGVVSDSPNGGNAWGINIPGIGWIYSAMRGGNESFASVAATNLTNGKYPKAGAGGALGDGALSEDATSVNSAKPLTLNGATRPAWYANFEQTLQTGPGTALAVYSDAIGDGLELWSNLFFDGAYRSINAKTSSYPTRVSFGNGVMAISCSNTQPTAGGTVADMAVRFQVNRFGGVGFFGVTPPTTRPTVNAACTDLATCIALTNQLRTHLIACGLVQ